MGVAALHLVGDVAGDIVEIEPAFFPAHLGVKHDLKQQIAELLAQSRPILALDRIRHLIGFFDGVGRDGAKTLLLVPRATRLGIAQPGHDLEQPRHGIAV